MMVERLQGYRMDVNNPNTKGFAPGVVRELLDHIAQLEAQADESSATMERLSGVVERYRGGVLPSSAERCALRWSHSSATDRGSFGRGWEAREAEGIEAQRGGSDLVELIRRRYPRMLERGNLLYDGVLDDAVQRGGAVVVPTKMDDDDWEAIGFQQSTEGQLQRVWDRAVSRIQPIPAGGALADGMVGVDREEVERLSKAITDVAKSSIHYPIGSVGDRAVDALCEAFAPIWSTIRSAKGEVEG